MQNRREFNTKDFIFHRSVDSESIAEVMQHILVINQQDKCLNDESRNNAPIRLFINTPGGGAYPVLALADVMINSKTPVHTYSLGRASSAGSIMFICGSKRFIGENSSIMIHNLNCTISGDIDDLQITHTEMKDLQKRINKIITSRTGITQKELSENIKLKKDWYFDVKTAIEKGIATAIYDGT